MNVPCGTNLKNCIWRFDPSTNMAAAAKTGLKGEIEIWPYIYKTEAVVNRKCYICLVMTSTLTAENIQQNKMTNK